VGGFAAHAFNRRLNDPVDVPTKPAEPKRPDGARLGFFVVSRIHGAIRPLFLWSSRASP